jgi:YfiH family protein
MELHSWFREEEQGIVLHKSFDLERTGIVTHAFTGRTGGVSQTPRDTLNLALHVGDDSNSVLENRSRLSSALGVGSGSMTTVEQVHGNVVAVISENAVGSGASDFAQAIAGADAMVTDVPGAVLSLFFADCVPIFIVDPENKCIGLAHAGWKGTALGVVKETLLAMVEIYSSRPESCYAAVGPSIGRCCYEVGQDVASALTNAVGVDERVLKQSTPEKWRADLKMANWKILRSCGVPEASIAVSQFCTCCSRDEFFSYRRDGQTGRMGAFLALK